MAKKGRMNFSLTILPLWRLVCPTFFQNKWAMLENFFPTLEKVFSTLEKIFSRHGKKISSVSVFLENIPASAARYSVTTMRDGRRGKKAVDGGLRLVGPRAVRYSTGGSPWEWDCLLSIGCRRCGGARGTAPHQPVDEKPQAAYHAVDWKAWLRSPYQHRAAWVV